MRNTVAQEYESIAPYIRVARRHPPLTREQEYALARRMREGDMEARRTLINHNLAFVLAICFRFAGKGCRMDDLVQEGNIGLLKAVDHFDPEKGNRFSTYASWWIRAYVQKFLRDMRATVKPATIVPGEAMHALPRDLSLDAPVGDEEDGSTHLDLLVDESPGPEIEYEQSENAEQVNEALERIRKRVGGLGWDIINKRFKLDEPQTLAEIGRDWNLSRERVRQIEKATREFLRRYLSRFDS